MVSSIRFFMFILLTPCALAANFYVDPNSGDINNDGSQGSPWSTLEEVIENNLISSSAFETPYTSGSSLTPVNPDGPIQSGDTIFLMSGFHGEIDLHQLINDEYIFIRAAAGQSPEISRLHIRAASKWSISGLSISPDHAPTFTPGGDIVFFENHGFQGPSSDIIFTDNEVFTVPNISSWTASQWLDRIASGVRVDAPNTTVSDNHIYNIKFGVQSVNNNATISDNIIENFSADGIRGLSSNSIYENNLIANGFDLSDGNHDDGFQSFIQDGNPVENVTLRGNKIYSDLNHPNPALRSDIQGIGCFDGFFENWRIENNLIVINHHNGITLLGARNSEIVNNTIVDADTNNTMRPWVRIAPHKNGSPSTNNLIRNNLGRLNLDVPSATADHNIEFLNSEKNSVFINASGFDFRLRDGSPAIFAGSTINAPTRDIDGTTRVAPIDAGAYAYDGTQQPPAKPSKPTGTTVEQLPSEN